MEEKQEPSQIQPEDDPKIKTSQGVFHLLELQRLLMRDAKREKTSALVRAQIARAWKDLEMLRRVQRGLPIVGPMPVQKGARGGKPGNLIALPKPQSKTTSQDENAQTDSQVEPPNDAKSV